MKVVSFPKPKDVWRYFSAISDALDSIGALIETGGGGDLEADLQGLTSDELAVLRRELGHEVTLALVASAEAIFQTNFSSRVARRPRGDEVAMEMRTLANEAERNNRRIEFDEILDIWKSASQKKDLIGQFKQLLLFRHWLAQGRYWSQKSGLVEPDPYDAWEITRQIFQDLPGFEKLEPLQ